MHYVSGVGSSVLKPFVAVSNAIRPLACRIAAFVYSYFKAAPIRDFNGPEDDPSYLRKTLTQDVFGESICGFLEPKDLEQCMLTCQAWNKCFQRDKTWENLCQIAFGANALPAREGSEDPSYKDVFQRLHNRFFGQPFYERYIGSVGQVPPIPQGLSPFVVLDRPDPCDPDKKVGEEYVWMYVPSHFYVHSRSEVRFEEFYSQGFQVEGTGKDRAVKVPVTINNLPKLFAKPKEGHPSKYRYIFEAIPEQHGDTEHPGGWICMRREVVDRGRSWRVQKRNASRNGVIIPELLPRILLNFSWNARSGTYLDGRNPPTLARTATTITRSGWPLDCGDGAPFGLFVQDSVPDGDDRVGVAVALP